MKNKVFLLALYLLTLNVVSVNAQLLRFSVTEFAHTPSDLTARDEQFKQTDDNGTLYSIIKVTSDQPDDDLKSFRFDFGLMNSFVVPHPEAKELWVYVQKNAKMVNISRDGYVSVSKYDLGLTIRAGYTYRMKLAVAANTAEKKEVIIPTGTLSVISHPAGASIKVDGKEHGQTPNNVLSLAVGMHTLTLELDGYKEKSQKFEIQENQTTNIDLELELTFAGNQEEYSFTVDGNNKKVTFKMKLVEADTTIMVGGNMFKNHPATIANDYYMGEAEVTQGLWYAVMGQKPITSNKNYSHQEWESKYGIGDNMPAYYINYNEIQPFLKALNQMTGQQFRVPTDAEWEFAAKGGRKSHGYTYSGSNAKGNMWFSANSDSTLHEVKGKKPNELGLYDMSGNVAEIVVDAVTGKAHFAYGGHYESSDYGCMFNSTLSMGPGDGGRPIIGFRLAMSPINNAPVDLTITSDPTGANIKIDGEDYGKTPTTIPQVTSGHHVVELSAAGYFTESREMEIFRDCKINMELDYCCPDSNHPHQIDMGNGVKWACCNVEASKPADVGKCCLWHDSRTPKNWRMPTREEMKALDKNCVWTWTCVDGVEGYKVKAPNGNCIFLPKQNYWSSSENDTTYPRYDQHYRLSCFRGERSIDYVSTDPKKPYKYKFAVRPVVAN